VEDETKNNGNEEVTIRQITVDIAKGVCIVLLYHVTTLTVYHQAKILYYIKNQQDATLAVLFISNCKITLHVSDAFCVHHQEN
jgi:hypothetical protein